MGDDLIVFVFGVWSCGKCCCVGILVLEFGVCVGFFFVGGLGCGFLVLGCWDFRGEMWLGSSVDIMGVFCLEVYEGCVRRFVCVC